MSGTVAAPAIKSIVFKGKKPLKEHVRKAVKRGLISVRQLEKIKNDD